MTPRQYIAKYKEFLNLAPPAKIFLYGNEELLKDGLIRAFRKPIEDVEDFCTDVFWLNELKGKEPHKRIFDSLLTLPMLGHRRLVILRSFDISRAMDKKIIAGLENFSFPDGAILVVESQSLDRRIAAGKKIEKIFRTLELSTPDERTMGEWINYFVRRNGKRIAPSAIMELIALAGISLCAIREEVNKLTDFVDGDLIAVSDVREISSQSRSAHIFQFSNLLLELNFRGALRTAMRLIDFGEKYSELLRWIGKALTDLLWAHIDPAGLKKRLGKRAFLARKIEPSARKLKTEAILKAIVVLHRVDVMMKSSAIDERTAIVWAIGRIQEVLSLRYAEV